MAFTAEGDVIASEVVGVTARREMSVDDVARDGNEVHSGVFAFAAGDDPATEIAF